MAGRKGLAGWLLLCFAVALTGAWNRPGPWFQQLRKPRWQPPARVFPPVWTSLYATMGVAAWQLSRSGRTRDIRLPRSLFLLQLIFNGLWSWLFFGRHRIGLALLDLAALWASLAATVASFWKIQPRAGRLLLPYLGWTSFAAALNYRVWQLNRQPPADRRPA